MNSLGMAVLVVLLLAGVSGIAGAQASWWPIEYSYAESVIALTGLILLIAARLIRDD
jgi:hypothetical protein